MSISGLKVPVDGSKINLKGVLETADHAFIKFAVKKCIKTTKTGEKCFDETETNY